MNADQSTNPQPAATNQQPIGAGQSWQHWLKLILAGNPFYLVSAACLLFGINRLSVDPTFLNADVAKLAFNFTALEVYEILLVVTAIFLARRRIEYDATLLVCLENLLVLAPFVLVAQAVLIDRPAAVAVCAGGAMLAATRFGALKRLMPELNLPPRLLMLGGIILAFNLVLPLWYRWVIESGENRVGGFTAWEKVMPWLWCGVLPLLAAGANGLPRPRVYPEEAPRKSWLPLLCFTLWIGATAYQLWALGYVSNLDFSVRWLTPVVWVMSWTAYRRCTDLAAQLPPWFRTTLLAIPMIVTLTATARADTQWFLFLTLLNLAGYALVCRRKQDRPAALQCLLISAAALLAGLPESWGQNLMPVFTRTKAVFGAATVWIILQSLWLRSPVAGICGAIFAALVPMQLAPELSFVVSLAVQSGLVFLLVHSLRWDDEQHPGAALVRWLTASAWAGHSLLWTFAHEPGARWTVNAAVVLVVSASAALRWLRGHWGPLLVWVSAALSLLAGPLVFVTDKLKSSPTGLLAMIGSFLLFGLGTVAAMTKHRWHQAVHPPNVEPHE